MEARVGDSHAQGHGHLLPQLRSAEAVRGLPSQDVRPAADGERHRITVGGPGVMPVMQIELAGLTKADLRRDDEFNSMFDHVMAGDRSCAGER